jgi:hypothetical protein
MSEISKYVIENWDTLPKSYFNEDEVVIIVEYNNSEEGYGHHSYSGAGIDKEGRYYYCFSSGCSCNGSCGIDHKETLKVLEISGEDISSLNPEDINFDYLQVSFSDYD